MMSAEMASSPLEGPELCDGENILEERIVLRTPRDRFTALNVGFLALTLGSLGLLSISIQFIFPGLILAAICAWLFFRPRPRSVGRILLTDRRLLYLERGFLPNGKPWRSEVRAVRIEDVSGLEMEYSRGLLRKGFLLDVETSGRTALRAASSDHWSQDFLEVFSEMPPSSWLNPILVIQGLIRWAGGEEPLEAAPEAEGLLAKVGTLILESRGGNGEKAARIPEAPAPRLRPRKAEGKPSSQAQLPLLAGRLLGILERKAELEDKASKIRTILGRDPALGADFRERLNSLEDQLGKEEGSLRSLRAGIDEEIEKEERALRTLKGDLEEIERLKIPGAAGSEAAREEGEISSRIAEGEKRLVLLRTLREARSPRDAARVMGF